MSDSPRLARAAAQVLSERTDRRRPSDDVRKRATSAIREALAARARAHRRRRFVVAASAVAAALVLGLGASIWRSHTSVAVSPPKVAPPAIHLEETSGSVFVVRGDARAPVADQSTVGLGEHVVSANGKATLVFASGTRLDLEPSGELAVTHDDTLEVVHLSSGAVTARVAKVAAHRRFVVRTPEADVEVRGTVFRVSRSVDDRCGVTTRVRVDEGLVGVRSAHDERSLGPGSEWTSPCESRPEPSPESKAAAQVEPAPASADTAPSTTSGSSVAKHAAPPSRPASPAGVAAAEPAPSELAVQNALFRSAMASKERGDARRAVADLDTLLTRHPKTPLREAALAQRMKLLATFDRGAATAAARAYLATYPGGFARTDAEALATGRVP